MALDRAVRQLTVPALGPLELAGVPAERVQAGANGSSEGWATAAELDAFRQSFAKSLRAGVHPALAHLNARTRFRFTALYRSEGSLLRGVCLYDRENPTLRCGLPALATPACYLAAPIPGVALRLSTSELAGVLLHTHPRPRILVDGEREWLGAIASLLARWLAASPRGERADCPCPRGANRGIAARHGRRPGMLVKTAAPPAGLQPLL